MGKFFIETYGCQMNTAESNAIESLLVSGGWTSADMPEDADLDIINTCSVRKSAENRIWGRLGAFKHIKAERAKNGLSTALVLTGCMADRLKDELK
ncbi:MAG: tRNA (N6-isopentenyl adenosine(37)-C2)-methylthiotransferase MiaB, partial [Spirochaetales bacterium]